MFRIFCKYLFLHKKAHVPGVGIFFIKRQAARHDFINKVFNAPLMQIGFQHKTDVATDKQFYSFVCEEQQVDEPEAIKLLNEFSLFLQEDLNAKKQTNLPGIGQLVINETGALVFEPAMQMQHYFPDVAAEKVMKGESEPRQVADDRGLMRTDNKVLRLKKPDEVVGAEDWWIYAIILAVIGASAIVYYYVKNGSLQ